MGDLALAARDGIVDAVLRHIREEFDINYHIDSDDDHEKLIFTGYIWSVTNLFVDSLIR